MRHGDWKAHFVVREHGWAGPKDELNAPLLFNLRRDPYERSELTSNTYYDWMIDRVYLLVPAQQYVGNFLQTFKKHFAAPTLFVNGLGPSESTLAAQFFADHQKLFARIVPHINSHRCNNF